MYGERLPPVYDFRGSALVCVIVRARLAEFLENRPGNVNVELTEEGIENLTDGER